MNDYQKGWREALRVLKRDVDENKHWGAGDIYDRIVELLGEQGAPCPHASFHHAAPRAQ